MHPQLPDMGATQRTRNAMVPLCIVDLNPSRILGGCSQLSDREEEEEQQEQEQEEGERGATGEARVRAAKRKSGAALRGWGVVGRPAFFFAGSIMGACAPGLHKSFGYCCKHLEQTTRQGVRCDVEGRRSGAEAAQGARLLS